MKKLLFNILFVIILLTPLKTQALLLDAVSSNDLKTAEDMIKNGADLNSQDKDGNTALILAVQKYYPEMIKLLIDSGANLNIQNNEGQTALFYAEYTKLAKYLIKCGADLTIKDKEGKTAYTVCMDKNWDDDMSMRLCNAIHPQDEKYSLSEIYDKNSASDEYAKVHNTTAEEMQKRIISRAVLFFDCDTIEKYLNAGNSISADVPSLYDDGDVRPLIVLLTSFPQCLAQVIPNDIDINQTFDDDTLLMYAIYNQNLETVELLLNKGANVNIFNRNQLTPLAMAVSQNDVKMVDLLLKHNADTTIRNENGEAAFDMCRQVPTMEVCKLMPGNTPQ